jgi:hypothetical protein
VERLRLDQTQLAQPGALVALDLTLIQRGLLLPLVAQADTMLAAVAVAILLVEPVVLVALVVAEGALMALLERLELPILAAAVDRDLMSQLAITSTAPLEVREL